MVILGPARGGDWLIGIRSRDGQSGRLSSWGRCGLRRSGGEWGAGTRKSGWRRGNGCHPKQGSGGRPCVSQGGDRSAAREDGEWEGARNRAARRFTRARLAELRGPPAWLPSPAVGAAARAGRQAGISAGLRPGWVPAGEAERGGPGHSTCFTWPQPGS